MGAYWGDGDGMNALSSYMFQLGSNYEQAVSTYQQYYCRDISTLSETDYHINVIPLSKRAQVSRILWQLKKLKFQFALSANTLCEGSAVIDDDECELEYNYYANDGTNDREPDFDTDFNRHVYFIPGETYSASDQTAFCQSPSSNPLPGEDWAQHQVSVNAEINLNNPTIGFRYYFDGDVDDPSNCIGFGIENLADGFIQISEIGPRDYTGYDNIFAMRRTDYYQLGSIVPKTAVAAANLNHRSWGGVSNEQASLQNFYDESIGGITFGVSVGRNATSISSQTSEIIDTDVNSGVIGDYSVFALNDTTFK